MAKQRNLLLLAAAATGYSVTTTTAFAPTPLIQRRQQQQQQPALFMGGAHGVATTREGKAATVTAVKELLNSAELIFTVPGASMTVSETESLRRSMPEGTTIKMIKNTLMRRALEDTPYAEPLSAGTDGADLIKGSNMWFFIQEDIGGTMKSYNEFAKETEKTESHMVKGGVMEGIVYDAKGLEAIGKLPSKQELYATIAGRLKGISTKLARVIKAPNNKLARAIKLATMPEGDGEGGAAE